MSDNSFTNHFQVGDKVRRKKGYRKGFWKHGSDAVLVEGIDGEAIVITSDGFKDTWDARNFDFVERPPLTKSITDTVVTPSDPFKTDDPFTTQVGGDHYKSMGIQPIDYITANNLPFIEGNIVKYITRWKQKGGVQDIDKVIHYAEMLRALELKKVSSDV